MHEPRISGSVNGEVDMYNTKPNGEVGMHSQSVACM